MLQLYNDIVNLIDEYKSDAILSETVSDVLNRYSEDFYLMLVNVKDKLKQTLYE